jgi:predicted glutamine amidotransferase
VCELFCLSSAQPTTVSFSLEQLARHGALGQANVDGWGLAFYDDRDVRLYKEPEPAGESAWLTFILGRDVECALAMSHIRRASQGGLTHANTQPFTRELAGRMHVFDHNGDLRGLTGLEPTALEVFTPVGETDSELAFCLLLETLAPLWLRSEPPSPAERLTVVRAFADDMRARGEANFLYSDGELLFAHAHRRRPFDGVTNQPGLWRLDRAPAEATGKMADHGVRIGAPTEALPITLVASVPLTDDAWTPLQEAEIAVLRAGSAVVI